MFKVKLANEKMKGAKAVDDMKKLKDEVLAMKLKAARNSVVKKFVFSFVVVLVVVLVNRVV